MAFALQYFYCFYVFMFISIILPGVVSGQINAEGVYKLLSWRLDDILTETKSLKSKVDNIDNRLKSVEEKMLEIQTTTPNSIELTLTEDKQELQKELKENIEMQALAVKNMLFTEKKLLRESMNNFNAVFADLKSEIQTHMLEFNSSLKTGIHNIGTEFDNLKAEIQLEMSTYNKTLSDALSISNANLEAKLEDMNEIVNNNSIMITTGIAKIASELNSTTHNVSQILLTINKSMLSNIEETETRIIAKFDKKQNDILKNVSSLRTDLGSLSSIVSSISSSISNRINSELLSLSSRISSVSSSLTSESLSLLSRISSISSSVSSLSGRISAEEGTNGGWSVWTDWNVCSATCNTGVQTRQRQCNNPEPSSGGQYCQGSTMDVVLCNKQQCPQTNGGWSVWADWTDCSATCNTGVQTRQRQCNNPVTSSGGQYCQGSQIDVVQCNKQQCPQKKVAFSARIYNQPDSIYLPKEKIIFETVYYNEGSGYNSSSGVFTAPKTGTYIFTVNIEATNDGRGHVLVMVNGNYYCEALAAKGYYNKGGCTAVAYVYSGQQAWVQAADVGLPQIYVYKYRTQFNGFLID